jgi:hypothetical protein
VSAFWLHGPFNPDMGPCRFAAGSTLVILSYLIVSYREGRRWDIASISLLLGGVSIWTY